LTISSFFYYQFDHPRDLHSFPTRRSSDLATKTPQMRASSADATIDPGLTQLPFASIPNRSECPLQSPSGSCGWSMTARWTPNVRSEEHTSELQSQSNLVCRLLLEKKKYKHRRPIGTRHSRPPGKPGFCQPPGRLLTWPPSRVN